MPCYKPLTGWYGRDLTSNGKFPIVFDPGKASDPTDPQDIPCGQCVGCRINRSKQWALRCMHEASLYRDNCFVTLTFEDDYLKTRENPWSLDVKDTQLFMKRLRKRFGSGIRFYLCGEYGEHKGRPHYHVCLFNFDFPDKSLYKIVNGNRLYTSEILHELWPFGHCVIGDVTMESAGYVARYVMKKVNGDAAKDYYIWADFETGEIHPLKPEFTTMSRRPGIGKGWLDKFKTDIYPSDFVTVKGKKYMPPKYYDKILEAEFPMEMLSIKADRENKVLDRLDDLTPERLSVREKLQLRRADQLVRNHDKG